MSRFHGHFGSLPTQETGSHAGFKSIRLPAIG